jgi:hypothetical protein
VTDRPDIDVRLAALKLFFGHSGAPLQNFKRARDCGTHAKTVFQSLRTMRLWSP